MQRVIGSIIIILISLLTAIGPSVANEAPTEYQVKAAFLFNFLKYISWAADSPLSHSGVYHIGLIGSNPFGSALDDIVGGALLEGRPVRVSRVSNPDSLRFCHIVFISGISDTSQQTVFSLAEQSGVVTVGESATFIETGGVIRLQLHDDQVRFDINLAAASRSEVKISSKLLKLAQNVTR